ncbi:hypothetical protein [Bifidobacterium parmae]|uniref:Uncharacterized protein n=1 Tax=Bifidobacterium parmae TaxID=361854 RepID=A0A2N5J4M3_9BIFI|nr:hypothetical protein [Bifidobacterium parmae]PLS29158.1 hypothetical protein Uis4E_0736 [Bifidobacterium parmae]
MNKNNLLKVKQFFKDKVEEYWKISKTKLTKITILLIKQLIKLKLLITGRLITLPLYTGMIVCVIVFSIWPPLLFSFSTPNGTGSALTMSLGLISVLSFVIGFMNPAIDKNDDQFLGSGRRRTLVENSMWFRIITSPSYRLLLVSLILVPILSKVLLILSMNNKLNIHIPHLLSKSFTYNEILPIAAFHSSTNETISIFMRFWIADYTLCIIVLVALVWKCLQILSLKALGRDQEKSETIILDNYIYEYQRTFIDNITTERRNRNHPEFIDPSPTARLINNDIIDWKEDSTISSADILRILDLVWNGRDEFDRYQPKKNINDIFYSLLNIRNPHHHDDSRIDDYNDPHHDDTASTHKEKAQYHIIMMAKTVNHENALYVRDYLAEKWSLTEFRDIKQYDGDMDSSANINNSSYQEVLYRSLESDLLFLQTQIKAKPELNDCFCWGYNNLEKNYEGWVGCTIIHGYINAISDKDKPVELTKLHDKLLYFKVISAEDGTLTKVIDSYDQKLQRQIQYLSSDRTN